MTDLNLADWTMVEELVERAGTRTPDYAEDAIALTARVRQRPAWTFAGRWVPAGVPLRGLRWGLLAATLALALLAGLLWAGAQPSPSEPLTGNGLIAVSVCDEAHRGFGVVMVNSENGRIAPTGSSTWPGSVLDFSPDGTRLAYLVPGPRTGVEALCTAPATGSVYVSAADGSGARRLTDDLALVTGASWSPDGRRLAVSFGEDTKRASVALVATDGSGTQVLELGGPADSATWQPTGNLILFRGMRQGHKAIYTVSADNPTDIRPVAGVDVVASESGIQPEAAWSPDGRWVAYVRRVPASGQEISLHVVAVDGAGDRDLPVDSYEGIAMRPRWSPDGSQIVAQGWNRLVVATADGSTVSQIGPQPTDGGLGFTDFVWSPDGRIVAAGPTYPVVPAADGTTSFGDDPRIALIDVATNTWTGLDPGADMPVQLVGGAALGWQAVAP